jgi:creatinine amidohydrolase/Fe(II)-dependent formamide hydrolase-like protein
MNVRGHFSIIFAGSFIACAATHSPQPTMVQDRAPSGGGYSIFHETMADMTYPEIEAAAKRHAILLWPMGVIEEHGPQLPLGTDIYNAYAMMKQLARLLKVKAKEVLIAPPMYWGINDATGAFGGSFNVRPSTLRAIIEDTFASFRKDGFQTVYMITGHGDRLHNQVIVESVAAANASTGMHGFVVIAPIMRDRLGLAGTEPHVVVTEGPPAPAPPPRYVEVHAGGRETSIVWYNFPALVKTDMIPKLPDTKFGPDDLAEWRKGGDTARAKTPLGYLGDPASASLQRGEQAFHDDASLLADAILKHMERSP